MNRYLKSFIITIAIYATTLGLFLLFTNNFKKPAIKTQRVVNIKVINYQSVKKIKNLEPKKEEKTQEKVSIKEEVVEKKIEPTKEIKKGIKPIKKEKIVKKSTIKKPKKILKKVVKKRYKKIKKTKKVTKKRYTKSKKIGKKDKKRAKVKRSNNNSISNTTYTSSKALSTTNYNFLSDLIRRINQNKSYPAVAVRRGLSGVVKVYFTILPNGNVANIRVDGSNIFVNAAKRAVKNSFPIDTKGIPFSLPKNVSFTMRFILR